MPPLCLLFGIITFLVSAFRRDGRAEAAATRAAAEVVAAAGESGDVMAAAVVGGDYLEAKRNLGEPVIFS
jgi:uncharacterized membrane protein YqiK